MQITNRINIPIPTGSSREYTEEGFLRCKCRVLAERVMPYSRAELEQIPPEITDDPILLFVGRDSISDPDSLRSLEGAAAVAGDHNWLDPEVIKQYQVGHVAGTPRMDGPYLECDLFITDKEAIEQIENKELEEISAAYSADAEFGEGEYEGQPYHAEQRQLRYNHVAIIPAGSGRAGRDVKILNKKNKDGGNQMSEDTVKMVRIKLVHSNKMVAMNEDAAAAVEEEATAMDGKLGTLMNELEEAKGGREELEAKIQELEGELSVYKEKLDELLGGQDAAVEEAAANMVAESEEAEEIMENSPMFDEEGEEIENEDKREEMMNSIKGVYGTDLHKKVLTTVGIKCENMSPDHIRGAFKAQHQLASSGKNRKVVAGLQMNNSMTQKTTDGAQISERNPLQRLGFPAKQ